MSDGLSLRCAIHTFDDFVDLESAWKALENKSECHFFLSWTWIGSWLEASKLKPDILVVLNNTGECVGLGMLQISVKRKYGLLLPVLYINESGKPDIDMVSMEYNAFLSKKGMETEVLEVCISFLSSGQERSGKAWKECYFGGVETKTYEALKAANRGVYIQRKRSTYYYDFQVVKTETHFDDILSRLSRNTRSQIRRGIKRYLSRGEVKNELAKDLQTALSFFEEMKLLHQKYWVSKGQPGAFSSPFFERFHHLVIKKGLEQGQVEMHRMSAGEELIGYLYNFVYRDVVYSYQSGFVYDEDKRYKPGIVSHIVAMEVASQQGRRQYNFLAGEARYKKSLSTGGGVLLWCTLYRNKSLYQIEKILRNMKHFLAHRSS